MDVKVFLSLLLLGAICCTARELAAPGLLIKETKSGSALSLNILQTERQLQPLKDASRNQGLCTLCEEYTTSALGYLANNETQSKILDILHQACSRMPIYKQECTVMVDQYVPVFFLEISSLKAEEICLKVDLCQEMVSFSRQFSQNSCNLCHQVVKEALLKLKDPDAQLDILELLLKACGAFENYAIRTGGITAMRLYRLLIKGRQYTKLVPAVRFGPLGILELLLKACGAVENYANKGGFLFMPRDALQCKKLVFEYAENFLEKNDVCSIVDACEPAVGKEEALPRMQNSLHSAS